MLAILDYKAGNQTSVRRALDHIGVSCCITADPAVALAADGIIFPGVGAAGQAMDNLRASGMDTVLRDAIARRIPVLGICLGCQIMLDRSEENDTPTLGLVHGVCRRFDPLLQDSGLPVRIPHMGWNTLSVHRRSTLLEGVPAEAAFYFVHSYYVETDEDLVIASTRYGVEFCSVYGRDGLWAVQFHPEKSGRHGLRILHNFATFCHEKERASC